MKNFKGKKYFWKRQIIAFLLIFCFSFFPLFTRNASAWDAIPAAVVKQVMEEMTTLVNGLIRGLLKTMAATVINTTVSAMISGGSGGPKFITNWENYIVRQGAQKANSYVNDYLTQAGQGRGSSSGYAPAPGFEGIGQGAFNMGVGAYTNYSARLVEQAKAAVLNESVPKITANFNPSTMLSGGTFKKLSQLGSGVNNQWALNVSAEEKKLQELEDAKNVAMAKAIAGAGFIGTEKNGQTITPGSVVKENLTNTQNIGNQIIAAANTIPEIVTGLVTKIVTQAINQGIGTIQSQIQKQVTGVVTNARNSLNQQIQNVGPGALFKR